jgi:hypothetical protein
MNTITQNFKIKEKDKNGDKLKDEFILNCEALFAKSILDLVKEKGNEITIKKVLYSRQNIEEEENIIVNDEGKQKIVKDKKKIDCYNCTALIQILKITDNTFRNNKRCIRSLESRVSLNSNNEISINSRSDIHG